MRTPPPGISAADFASALKEFAAVVGPDWVLTSEEDLETYRDAYSPLRGQPDERKASAAVAPDSAEEVQAIVRIANRYGVPLYPISTGKNLGYGGSAPAQTGSVVLDLKRLNRIIEVNEESHYCIVEPGVSYFDIYNYIQERGLKLWVDVPDPGWGSLIGNALDHGVGHSMAKYRNHFESHCGMEVVLADGEVLRTGMGAMPGAQTWAAFKMGFGPLVSGIFSQSNFGVVTKMGFWMMPAPEAFLQATVLAPRFGDLHEVIQLLKYSEALGLAGGMPSLGSPILASGGDSKSMADVFLNGPPQLAPEHGRLLGGVEAGYSKEIEAYALQNNIPYWRLLLNFYGPAKVVAAQWEAVQDIARAKIKGVTFKASPIGYDPKAAAAKGEVGYQDVGIPNLEFFAMGTRAGGNPMPNNGHLFYSPMIPQTAEALIACNKVFQEAARTMPVLQKVPIMNLKPFSVPAGFHERAFMMALGFPIMDDQDINNASIAAFRELVKVGADHGWGEYRTSPIFYDQVMGTYSFNDHALLRFNEKLKDAVDPKGILSPGRFGIWPKHLRKT
jgi:4-cresol dehydrogenase (hydroxylating)